MKKTISFTLGEQEFEALEHLSRTKSMSRSAILRLAIKFYYSLDQRLSEGAKLFVEDEITQNKAELLVL